MLSVDAQQLGERERIFRVVTAQRQRFIGQKHRGGDRTIRGVRVSRVARAPQRVLAERRAHVASPSVAHSNFHTVYSYERANGRSDASAARGEIFLGLLRRDATARAVSHRRTVAKVRASRWRERARASRLRRIARCRERCATRGRRW